MGALHHHRTDKDHFGRFFCPRQQVLIFLQAKIH